MIKAIIVEDEDNSREILTTLIERYCPQVAIAGYAVDANDAVEQIHAIKPDVIFLDIELPYGNAFDILGRLKGINVHIVFTTAYDKYVLRAIKAGAIDYLLKPIDYLELVETVGKVEQQIAEKNNHMSIEQFVSSFSKHFYNNNLALPTMEGYNFIKLDEIIRISAEGNYCKIFCLNNQTYTITKQIHDIEYKLPPDSFCRVHNSHIVNIRHIKEYVKGRGGYLIMADRSQVDVSHRRKDEFLERFV
jgi:two-component system LytT family response regulator